MQQTQFRNRITTSVATVVTAAGCSVSSIVIAVADAGTSWTFLIRDKASPAKILVPLTTLAVPTTPTPVIIHFDDPIVMEGGIDVVTAGTPGVVNVWVTAWQ